MLTKRTRFILKTMNRTDKSVKFTLQNLAPLCHLQFYDLLTALKYMEAQGYVEFQYVCLPSQAPMVQSVSLTEIGKNYREFERAKIMEYIANKWTDIIASIISLISLIVSIVALSRTQ